MNPIKTAESNFVYLGPTPAVGDLPCHVEGNDTFSIWRPSPEERALIAAGGNVRLGIYGSRPIPPVSLSVVSNAGPYASASLPCITCGQESENRVHGHHGTHAFKAPCRKFKPVGFAWCTREAGHEGPCAHPLEEK